MALFNALRAQDKVAALSNGNANLFLTHQGTNLQLDVGA